MLPVGDTATVPASGLVLGGVAQSRARRSPDSGAVPIASTAMQPLAHQAWFTDERPPWEFDFLLQPLTLFSIAVTVLITIAWRIAAARFPSPELPFLRRIGDLTPWIPRLLGIHAGVSLIAQAYAGTFLAPSLELPDTLVGTLLAILEGIIGVWLVSGWKVKPAAWLLVAAGPLGMAAYGIVPILERIDLLAVAAFLALVPPSPNEHGAVDMSPSTLKAPLFVLRLMAGSGLIVLAVTEKLARPALAEVLIDDYPFLNIVQLVGIQLPDIEFIRFAGSMELLFGLLIISGAMPQVTVVAAGIPFNATLFFFGASELVGHLPMYGVMLALIAYGSHPTYASIVPWLPTRPGRTAERLAERL